MGLSEVIIDLERWLVENFREIEPVKTVTYLSTDMVYPAQSFDRSFVPI